MLTESKVAIENLGFNKIKQFFPDDAFFTSSNFADRFIEKICEESIYNTVFKN